jgi:hypothetical protein
MGWIFRAAFVIAFGMNATWTSQASPASTSPGEQRITPAKEYACGQPGKPCPLQSWMRATLASAATRGDADALAKGFDILAANAPPGYAEWTRIAKEGAALARKKDLEGAKVSCQACHGKYKSKYKEELRDRPL